MEEGTVSVGMQRHDEMPSRFLTRYADITDHTAKSPTRCKNAEALAPNPCQLRKKFRVILFPGDLILRAN